jgi:hypothetical protein
MVILTPVAICIAFLLAPGDAHSSLMQTLHQARIAEPQLAARVLTQTFKLDAEGVRLADLRGFDAQERTEMSETRRADGPRGELTFAR